MGLRVNTNILSMTAQRQLFNVSDRLAGNFRKLASGLRITSASDDPAGLGISERMRAEIRSLGQAGRNGADGIGLIQTSEGALNETNNNLARMRELAVQSANGTLNTGDRVALNLEFQGLIEEIERIAQTTDFNGIQLLNDTTGTIAIDLQIGTDAGETITISMVDMTEAGLGLDATNFDLSTVTNASGSLAIIDDAIDSVTGARGTLGSSQHRIQSAIMSNQIAEENLTAAESRIRDVDVASETADLTRNSILQQAAVSVLSQANVQPQIALSLLQ